MKQFCDTIATSIARCEKYRCWASKPKGPFRTKNTTTIVKIVNYYAVVFLLRPPAYVLRRGPFFERKNVCNSQENGVRTRRAAIANHSAIVNSVVNLLRVVF